MDKKEVINNWLEKAATINRVVRKRLNYNHNFKNLSQEQRLNLIHSEFKEFATNHPVVLRYMVQIGQYHPKAFELYLNKMINKPYKSTDDYCKLQADYIKYLNQYVNNSHNETVNKNIWTQAYNSFKQDVEFVEQGEKRARKIYDDRNKQILSEKRKELFRIIKKNSRVV